jgi:hypothetical protein
VVREHKMKNRMHAYLARNCMHPMYMSESLVVSYEVGSIIYNMGLFIMDYVSPKRFS